MLMKARCAGSKRTRSALVPETRDDDFEREIAERDDAESNRRGKGTRARAQQQPAGAIGRPGKQRETGTKSSQKPTSGSAFR